MADGSHIEWTDATWQPITGCSVVSPGCTNCYAMRLAGTRLRHHPSRAGLTRETKAGPVWTGEVRFNEEWLDQPLRWQRGRRIFVCAHGDLFHEDVPDAWIDRVFAVMALCPQHTFQVLTKRAKRMRDYFSKIKREMLLRCGDDADVAPRRLDDHACDISRSPCAAGFMEEQPWPLSNVWLGVSVEDQERADVRIPHLLRTPAQVRFLSCEPLLGPLKIDVIDLDGHFEIYPLDGTTECEDGDGNSHPDLPRLDWVIAGGESGSAARPMHPDWARSIRDQCVSAGVPFFFKQWGEWAPEECADFSPTRTEQTASYWNDRWDFSSLTPKQSQEIHEDDAPDVYRIGRKAAGARLDGKEWRQMPESRA